MLTHTHTPVHCSGADDPASGPKVEICFVIQGVVASNDKYNDNDNDIDELLMV